MDSTKFRRRGQNVIYVAGNAIFLSILYCSWLTAVPVALTSYISSKGQWMIFTAQDRRPKRILEIGCYSGYSALAWYEGTKETQAEIVTLELSKV